jgi:hypothetical protein
MGNKNKMRQKITYNNINLVSQRFKILEHIQSSHRKGSLSFVDLNFESTNYIYIEIKSLFNFT